MSYVHQGELECMLLLVHLVTERIAAVLDMTLHVVAVYATSCYTVYLWPCSGPPPPPIALTTAGPVTVQLASSAL